MELSDVTRSIDCTDASAVSMSLSIFNSTFDHVVDLFLSLGTVAREGDHPGVTSQHIFDVVKDEFLLVEGLQVGRFAWIIPELAIFECLELLEVFHLLGQNKDIVKFIVSLVILSDIPQDIVATALHHTNFSILDISLECVLLGPLLFFELTDWIHHASSKDFAAPSFEHRGLLSLII